MAANALRLRRSLALTASILNHPRNFTSVVSSVAAPPSSTIQQNPSQFDIARSKSSSISFQFISSRAFSSRARYNNDDMDGDQISPDAILFEGCDYNHWLITMDFPKDPKPSPEEMVETYVQTAAKVLGSVEEAKKKIYACSTTTYNGFQVEVSEEVSEQFKGLPGVVFVLPDSYIDPVNKEYGGDKYINGTIIPRPPPVQYGRQSGRYNDRNRDYNRPPRGRMDQNSPVQQNYGNPNPMNNAPGGQGNYQGDRRGPMPTYQSNYNAGEGRNLNPARQTDFPTRDQGNYARPEQRDFTPPVGNYSQGGGGNYRQGTGGQYGQPSGGSYGQGTGGQYGQGGGGNYRQGTGGQYGQGGGGNFGQGTGGQYGQGTGGQYGQGTGGQYGQGGGGSFGQGTGGQYGQGNAGNFGQATGGQYGQRSGGSYGQGTGGQYSPGAEGGYGQGIGSPSNQSSSQYGENLTFSQMDQRNNVPRQQGNHEVIEEAEFIKER
ncbi:hypothetical protein L6452_22660 [Arctium lappa]|uniref:Uncharacterized protein n=1 Tax=Arctium lappa TaxID=4217 RepID=A0ACB9B1C5_ARCLA|nr:hypothetical protein L6452_22660 [Arctium lappa]